MERMLAAISHWTCAAGGLTADGQPLAFRDHLIRPHPDES